MEALIERFIRPETSDCMGYADGEGGSAVRFEQVPQGSGWSRGRDGRSVCQGSGLTAQQHTWGYPAARMRPRPPSHMPRPVPPHMH